MKWAIYNLLFLCVYPFLLPGFLVRMLRRGGYAARMGDRFAIYPQDLFGEDRPLYDSHSSARGRAGNGDSHSSARGRAGNGDSQSSVRGRAGNGDSQSSARGRAGNGEGFVWIHAVSVGEVQVAGQLMREWRKVEPDVRFCFSTTSSTGWKMAEREVTAQDVLIYNPLDFPNFVKSALRTVRPRAIVLTESEIWPCFIMKARKAGIPLFLINARVSDRSAPRYKLARWWFGDVLSSFTRIFAQSELDKRRLCDAGAPEEKVVVTGSFKFDVAHRNEAKEKELREWIFGEGMRDEKRGMRDEKRGMRRILLGGSTWPGEDEVLLKIYKSLLASDLSSVQSNNQTIKQSNNSPILVIAPRHFEKADAVEENIRKAGFTCIRRSQPPKTSQPSQPSQLSQSSQPSPPVFLADTTGELMGLYGIADAVFVGKSLCAHGSQNMIEPCLCGKPTFVGPYTENFRPVMSDLLESKAIVQVKDADELGRMMVGLFSGRPEGADGTVLNGLGERARAAVERRCGVVPRCVAAIREAIA